MADDVEMTPITEAEGGALPPKVSPFGAGAAPAAPAPAAGSSPTVSTIRLKPVIRKPSIHKPTIGGPKPMVPPVAAPAAPAKKATQNLKSVTGPIPVAASLKKTGIIAEGIITPAQQQAAKSKTSRISLESAIGVAPASKEGPAPLKTIRLRRPTEIKPGAPAPAPMAAPAPAPAPMAAAPAPAPVVPPPAAPVAADPVADLPADESNFTQKKTLKLHRPGATVKAPMPGIGAAAPAADVPEMAPIAPMDFGAVEPARPEIPGWVTALSLVASLAAVAAAGLVAYYLWQECQDPMQFFLQM